MNKEIVNFDLFVELYNEATSCMERFETFCHGIDKETVSDLGLAIVRDGNNELDKVWEKVKAPRTEPSQEDG